MSTPISFPFIYKSGKGWQIILYMTLAVIPLYLGLSFYFKEVLHIPFYWVFYIVIALNIPTMLVLFYVLKVGTVTIEKYAVTSVPDTFLGIKSGLPSLEATLNDFSDIVINRVEAKSSVTYRLMLNHANNKKLSLPLFETSQHEEAVAQANAISELIQKPVGNSPP